jgi:DNA-binding transcriptional ArsR family regulator
VSTSLASRHLALLRMARLADRKRKGKADIYSLAREKMAPLGKFLAGLK